MNSPRVPNFWRCLLLLVLGFLACKSDPAGSLNPIQGSVVAETKTGRVDFPGDMDGARQLLTQFLDPDLNKSALTQKLRPTPQDFKTVFKKSAVKSAYQGYETPWNEGKIVVRGRPGQTELMIWSATTEELQQNKGDAAAFPGGYQAVSSHFIPGLRFYRFKFLAPGEALGFAWDGLIFVNGHWVIFPKPWRVLPVNPIDKRPNSKD